MSRWGTPDPTSIPDTACACLEIDRKEGIAEVRSELTDAIHGDLTADQWRRLAAKVVVRLRGL